MKQFRLIRRSVRRQIFEPVSAGRGHRAHLHSRLLPPSAEIYTELLKHALCKAKTLQCPDQTHVLLVPSVNEEDTLTEYLQGYFQRLHLQYQLHLKITFQGIVTGAFTDKASPSVESDSNFHTSHCVPFVKPPSLASAMNSP